MNDLDQYARELPEHHVEYFYKRCLITRIYDADTIHVLPHVGFGWGRTEPMKLRLYGINAPEVTGKEKAEGRKSRDWLRQKLCVPETKFDRWGYIINGVKNYVDLNTIKTPKTVSKRGKFGRYLSILWDENKANINWQLVDNKLAKLENY